METATSVIGMVLVVVSLIFAGVQTRELARQSRINNGIGRATALLDINNMAQAWHYQLMRDPALRAYFYEGKVSEPGDPDRSTVLTCAELLADILECQLHIAKFLPGYDYFESWHNLPTYLLKQSPVLAEVVEQHPDWWPTLGALHHAAGRSGGEPVGHPLLATRNGG